MSLEDKIGELTAAVNALTAALAHPFPTLKGAKPWVSEGTLGPEQAKAFVPDVTHNPVQAKAEVARPKPQPTASETSTSPTATGKPTAKEKSTDVGSTAPSNVIDYAQVAKAITDTFKVDRAKTIETLAMFGAAKGPQLKVEDYAMFLEVLTS